MQVVEVEGPSDVATIQHAGVASMQAGDHQMDHSREPRFKQGHMGDMKMFNP